ncbi:MAG: hypothetical protein M1825_005167 [Sarcosagium campestre]|nr:MAG: hypothetical protein M1825_005167 [Sarcosagium campestre]
MEDRAEALKHRRPRSRKSVAHMPSPDKENMTTDLTTATASKRRTSTIGRPSNKSRSKSIGPGGLDALSDETINRRKSASLVSVKSILKPTIPLSPLREIPSRAAAAAAASSKQRNDPKARCIALGTTAPAQKNLDLNAAAEITGAEKLPNPFHSASDTSMSTAKKAADEKAAREVREQQERWEAEKREIMERRDARRKSMGNRRVTFAPDATLHTWDVVEILQDSTTSSAATNSTRRASSATAASLPASPHLSARDLLPSSDPPAQSQQSVQGSQAQSSPTKLHEVPMKKRRRRSSAIPPMNFNDPDEVISSSPYSNGSFIGSDDTESQSMVIDGDSGFDSPSLSGDEDDDGGSTVMSLDDGPMTEQSFLSAHSQASSGSSNSRLDAALRQAATQAGTQGIDYDENGDLSMELAEEDVTNAFQPWADKDIVSGQRASQTEAGRHERLNPFSPAFKAALNTGDGDHLLDTAISEELTMEMTQAVGGILLPDGDDQSQINNDEDMSMEFTSVVGGLLMPKASEIALLPERAPEEPVMATPQQSPEMRPERDHQSSPMKDLSLDIQALEHLSTPVREARTPQKQITPQIPAMPKTPPGKTPPLKTITFRSASPRKLFKDEIKRMTPNKAKLRGRKSLAPGGATGLLGKRPAELDEDDYDDDDDDQSKRMKVLESSPVKSVSLPPPKSKTEITGRLTGFDRRASEVNSADIAPRRTSNVLDVVPEDSDHFIDAQSPIKPDSSIIDGEVSPQKSDAGQDGPLIPLQEFLNLTSIRFMDLTTTKRRNTMAFNVNANRDLKKGSVNDTGDVDLQSCVVAGACTLPRLDMYQHSCREMKRYIHEGREIVREIEADTLHENPPLFREYVTAAPDVRFIMDNQFKNVKTHARLESKAMWYDWRLKLFDGLREGLLNINRDMDSDETEIAKQEKLLDPVVPKMLEEHRHLELQHETLKSRAEDLANCDQEALREARSKLTQTKHDVQEKTRLLEQLQRSVEDKQHEIEGIEKTKVKCGEEIKEAERVRSECRGWSGPEVAALKGVAGRPPSIYEMLWG